MDVQDTHTHVFVIRIWVEEIETGRQVQWRGHVTHVMSENRKYLKDLDDLTAFIQAYVHAWDAPGRTPPES